MRLYYQTVAPQNDKTCNILIQFGHFLIRINITQGMILNPSLTINNTDTKTEAIEE